MNRERFRLYTDGACRGNPGPGSAGAVLTDAEGKVVHEWRRYLGVCTNNIAEYEALILGIRNCLAQGISRLDISLDSELLVKQVKGEYRVKNERLRELMTELQRLLSLLSDYDIMHIPREENRRADELANAALDEELKSQVGGSIKKIKEVLE